MLVDGVCYMCGVGDEFVENIVCCNEFMIRCGYVVFGGVLDVLVLVVMDLVGIGLVLSVVNVVVVVLIIVMLVVCVDEVLVVVVLLFVRYV